MEAAFLFRILGLPPFGGVLGGVVGGVLVGVVLVGERTDLFCGNFSIGIVTTWPLEVPIKTLLSSIAKHLMEMADVANLLCEDFLDGESNNE